ncbi:MAG TPA: GNAT family N-acyltransferase [Candidatus Binatia bacterium]|jgi:N-acyl-L-homoserine lactone synthetase|nr:GNAT family N-acyltransferase [Candidatus Binatia bacterium]
MPVRRDGRLRNLLRGYRFRVCESPDDIRRALDVRRQVYRDECGYDVAIPDDYDARSWMLLALDADSGDAVGSLRMTPRAAGPIEAEEYFVLPPSLTSGRIVEATRFAILPSHRTGPRFLPAVALGLFKLCIRYVLALGADSVVVCAKPERVWTYEWIGFERTGRSAPYLTLDGSLHELMVSRVGSAIERSRGHHRFWEFLVESDDLEIVVPSPAAWPDVARTG